MSAEAKAAADKLMQNSEFLNAFQNILLNGGGDLGDMPKDEGPARDEWLLKLQKKLQEEGMKSSKAQLEAVQKDEDGEWCFIQPEPGFCVKCYTRSKYKVFINICHHERIAEPMPIQSSAAKDDEIQFRIPLSCGQAKISKDKSNNECKVYDVVVSPKAIEKCKEDNEFRRFLVAVSMNWIQQKYEPTLNDEEFKNLNFKVKGGLEVQRVRLTRPGTGKDNKNAMGDEIKLPTGNEGGTAPTSRGPIANDKLIEEVVEPTVASIVKLEAKGSYDWSTHKSPTQNIFFKENVPKEYYVELLLPTIQTISEAEVIVTRKTVEIYSVDKEEGEEPLLRVVLDYPIDEDLQNAKFIRKKNLLKATITVKLPDETQPPESARSRDVVELEEEADRAAAALREEKYKQDLEKQRKIQEEEEEVLRQRRELVKNLSAVQEGELPPSLLEEIDAIPREQLVPFLHRLEHKVRKGDSLDTLMEKMPEETLWAVTNYIRKKLNLEPVVKQDKAPKKKVTFSDSAEKEGHAAADSTVEYNNSKKSDLLFGISFQNRYLFTLD